MPQQQSSNRDALLLAVIQRMIDSGESDEAINAAIAEWDRNSPQSATATTGPATEQSRPSGPPMPSERQPLQSIPAGAALAERAAQVALPWMRPVVSAVGKIGPAVLGSAGVGVGGYYGGLAGATVGGTAGALAGKVAQAAPVTLDAITSAVRGAQSKEALARLQAIRNPATGRMMANAARGATSLGRQLVTSNPLWLALTEALNQSSSGLPQDLRADMAEQRMLREMFDRLSPRGQDVNLPRPIR